ncbi:molybdenum cofactor guanylyltransferase MobA [Chromatium okenii]|uniref:molybdenum cofactor guanylyltransferase MobA n=1 Tax=Chromatium okenii TaxID=61644 RepID=UPI0034E956C7
MMTATAPLPSAITGVILAGGRARRMDERDKGLMLLSNRPLVAWAIAALKPQVTTLLISANRNVARYAAYGFPVVTDEIADFAGPLAGILSAMTVAQTAWLLTMPCDTPHSPADLGQRLAQAVITEQATLAVATLGRQRQPLHALLPVALAADLREYLASGERKVGNWYARQRVAWVDFSDRPNAFINLNTSAELRTLELKMPSNQSPNSRVTSA